MNWLNLGGASGCLWAVFACGAGCDRQPTSAPVSTPPRQAEPAEVIQTFKPTLETPGMGVAKMFREWNVADTAADALARIGEAAVPALIEGLADPNPAVRAQAARALARMGPKGHAAVPALILALEDEHESVRLNAARALGQIGPDAQEAVPALIRTLKDPTNQAPIEAPAAEVGSELLSK
ncbi:MAG TPA: HEAT repeat domain-containing protein [Thermomicrobiales bacterium]|nr:HEAT repeat domain-containing protein [Thermomicrobiales bacterium]